MGDPRNPARKYEEWNPDRLDVLHREIVSITRAVRGVVVSGGWAWHYLSPSHTEYKMLHDHKDVDLFIFPHSVPSFIDFIGKKYTHIWTRFDKVSKDFQRYEAHIDGVKVIIDAFVGQIPSMIANNGIPVVEPSTLLGMYRIKKHTTDDCIAVQAARMLVPKGISVLNNKSLVDMERV